jgi:hypothetical protein
VYGTSLPAYSSRSCCVVDVDIVVYSAPARFSLNVSLGDPGDVAYNKKEKKVRKKKEERPRSNERHLSQASKIQTLAERES